MSSNFVLRSYISGVQQYLADAGHIKYAMEGAAEVDNAALSAGLEAKVPQMIQGAGGPETQMNSEAIATEGMPAELNAPVAKAIAEMAAQAGEEAQVAQAKAKIIEQAAVEMASSEKIASVLIVSGQGKGTVNNSSNNESGKDEQIATQVDNDAERTSPRVPQGTCDDKGKGMQGLEGSEKTIPFQKEDGKSEQIATQVDNDATRAHATTAPGTEADKGKGMLGEEQSREKVSHILSLLNI